MYPSTFIVATLGAVLITVAAAQDEVLNEAALDAYLAQPDPQGCQVGPNICTCSLQASSGKCTRPLMSPELPLGVCDQQDCTESYKCDCLGFETCQISSCGQWKPTSPLPEPIPDRYPCDYAPNVAQCRKFDSFQDDTTAADNAKDQAVESVIDSVDEEEEAVDIVKVLTTKKKNLFNKMKECDKPKVDVEETDDLEESINGFVETMTSCQEDIDEALETSKKVYEQQRQAKKARRAAKEARKKEEAHLAELESKKDQVDCPTCVALKQKVQEARKARKEAAIAAGTWSKKARDGKKKVKKAKTAAKEKQLTAAEQEAQCIAKANRILGKLGAV